MNENQNILDTVKGKMIISCQALPEEPLHSPFIMGRMALAAKRGGSAGIRANSVEDIREIKKNVELPIIGIIKADYDNSEVFITPTLKEIDALYKEGVDMIALDATKRVRPDGHTIETIFPELKEKYPNQLFMADCSNYEEAITAEKLGFDCVSTTLNGYTSYTTGAELPDFQMIKKLVDDCQVPVIAEGGIWTPEQLKYVFELGVHTAVVGTAITRPMEIAKRFSKAIEGTI